MSIQVTLAGSDLTAQISKDQLQVQQIIGAQRDTATLIYRKFGTRSYVPTMFDSVLIRDGGVSIFGGRVINITELPINPASGVEYQIDCADYSIDLDAELVSQAYNNMTVGAIIADILTNFSTGFTGNNVSCTFTVTAIVFNQVPISQALKRLADLVQYNWYVDAAKDVHFFPKYLELAPYNLTDTSGNYLNGTLQTLQDGTQLANSVKVRGGTYRGTTYSDTITVKGSVTASWVLPYKFDEPTLTISINSVSKTVGIYGKDTFSTKDVLYRDQDQSIQLASPLADGSTIAFSGTPLIPVLAVAADAASIALYGTREKLVEDTSITDIDTARQRAIVELAAYKNPMGQANFDTLTPGLHVGQVITVNSTLRGVNDDFIIRQATFTYYSPTAFKYSIQAVTVRAFSLIDLLQQLLLPANMPIDPNEVSEIIKTDLGEVTITELITLHSSPDHTHTATVTISENIAHDPLGAHVGPLWVLGPYIPSGVSDTKRVINVDRTPSDVY
jgi:uncharacterized membrane protein